MIELGEANAYGLFTGAMLLFGVIVVALSLLVAYLAKNNVTMISVPAVKDLVMGVAGEIGKFAYNQARTSTSPIDDQIALALLGSFYQVTANEDGTITLVRNAA